MPVLPRRLCSVAASALVAGLLYGCGSGNQDAPKAQPKDVPNGSGNQDAPKAQPKDVPKGQGLLSDVDCLIQDINLEPQDNNAPGYPQSGAFGFHGAPFADKKCCDAMGETLKLFMGAQRHGELPSAVKSMQDEEAHALKPCGSPAKSSDFVFEVSNSEDGTSVGPAVCLVSEDDDIPGEATVQKLVMLGLSEKACKAFSSDDLEVRTAAIKELPTAFSVQGQLTFSPTTSEEAPMIHVLRTLAESMYEGAAAWRSITAHVNELQENFIM